MAENFVAEAVSSSGAVFASHIRASDSAHFPLGKIVWGGDSTTFNQTSSTAPFPVRLYGNSSSAPVHITTDSGAPPTVVVSGYVAPSTTVTVANIASNDTVVTVTQNSSSTPQFVTTDSGAPPLVSVSGYVAPSTTVTVANMTDTTVTVTGYTAPSTTVTVSNIANNDTTVTAILGGGQSSVTVTGTVTVEPTSSATIGLNARSSAVGAVQSITLALSSVAQSVMTQVGRLYGWSMSNPDTAANVWVKIYTDDSVTLGTSSALIDVMVPFGGGREADFAVGRVMSSGMSLTAAASPGSSAHDTPGATVYATIYFAPSS